MIKNVTLIIALLFVMNSQSHAGVTFNDDTGTSETLNTKKPLFYKTKDKATSTSRISTKTASDGISLRKVRRVAIGLEAAGSLGMGGALLELNFQPAWAVNLGYGGGEGFQSFLIQSKHILAGEWIMPYVAVGYANWTSIGESTRIEKTRPAVLSGRLLNEDEKAQGKFNKHLLIPSFGLQFMQLDGEYAGFSLFFEGNMLFDVANFVAAPTGGLGLMYFF